eukprot:CAMPEP_0201479152 /NCGR_PEP_ID=MMETSP0151_2-20130828/3873_1 /ASSEMBLY_ACC=CAM_ASM_000257 /TAXON_ID=200890 /ORGANISM="Paramoeba atlantica, Strain 621/1 / CCAP 1560/9" /LENGTH=197 /DNA_ID=CAMNT_0047860503 /DNA_START=146 /DNA_END=736 /DNA_ORIENTATION=+
MTSPLVHKTFVFPGDEIAELKSGENIVVGTGVGQRGDRLVALKGGLLIVQTRSNRNVTKFSIDSCQKRYVAATEDLVIGVVVEKHSEDFKVDLGCADLATLPCLAFEGASRKNRPNLVVGSLVYARVVVSNKDMSPEIVCYKANQKSEGLGELTGGYTFSASLNLCRSILLKKNPVLPHLGSLFAYEAAVGVNGKIW